MRGWRTNGTRRQRNAADIQQWLDEYCRLEDMPTIDAAALVEYLEGVDL